MQKGAKAPPQIDDDAVYSLTTKGKAELRGAGTALSAIELELLIHLDGESTVAQVAKRNASHARDKILESLDKMARDGLVAANVQSDNIEATGFFTRPIFPADAAAQADAAKQSDVTLQLLRRQGYVARIVKRPAAEPRKLNHGEKLTVLVIEDDAQLAKVLRMFMQLDGYEMRFAGNREQITAALRLGKPDLVLLDVTLPDVDGFDVLLRMRQHPVLKTVPILMMTAKATREAVLKGLAGGADGYITKPFDVDVISHAVKSVLGLK
jgi:CheY-like chemotaxis protein